MENKYEIKEVYSNKDKYLILLIDKSINKKYKLEFNRSVDGFIGYIPNNINKTLFYNTLFNYDNRLIRIIPNKYITLKMAITCACNINLQIPKKFNDIKELHNLRYLKTLDDELYDSEEIENISNIYQYIAYIEDKYSYLIKLEEDNVINEEKDMVKDKIIKLNKSISEELLALKSLEKEKQDFEEYLNNCNYTRKYIKLNRQV